MNTNFSEYCSLSYMHNFSVIQFINLWLQAQVDIILRFYILFFDFGKRKKKKRYRISDQKSPIISFSSIFLNSYAPI